ncbi:N-6 DNA methylase [Mycolicibacterium mucogenicum]|uniref:Eco57I restriction-modification methylase domain-containing protein n=1 Tax=Mycolicibacterium mucogenicum TaxID=56689 RepID=UPI00226A0487|nr:N-6 DNA methylase [Mycolicibacterium mucogenicum]MCX8564022.1 N-6 DNA methylase [Mycolicibacterium mucogenicum]
MADVLNADQRRHLDGAVQRARVAAEQAAGDVLRALAVAEPSRPSYLSDGDNALRLALREKARQLGDDTARNGADLTSLVREVAYEQWHRLLFARFLEVNGLLRHPEFRDTSLTLDDCADIADDLAEPDGWSVAARFASEILPGVFRLDDPAVRVRFATEHRLELERILLSIPTEVFETEDALGWVYQFWQTAEKKRVNESGVRIGGADLSPVTQLFTENYMVRFLLENSLGAWWAARHPESPLVASWEYLRRLGDGTPAAGTFSEWPATAAEVTVMDPACGSGHFLVAMFSMLWRMRAEEESLPAADAQDAVLRENLHGLELDPRCTQLATFNVALEAWKQGGFRNLPAPQIACSGVPVRASQAEWAAFAGPDDDLRKVLVHLHQFFQRAESLGSLIAPHADELDGALFGRDLSIGTTWESLRTALGCAMRLEQREATVLGHTADDVVHAAGLLAQTYTLVATNPPYLKRISMDSVLQGFIDERFPDARADIATAFLERCHGLAGKSGSVAAVSPQNWLMLTTFKPFRANLLRDHRVDAVARLGAGAFRQITGEVVKVALSISSGRPAASNHEIAGAMAHRVAGVEAKAEFLRTGELVRPLQSDQLSNPDSRITLTRITSGMLLEGHAQPIKGNTTGDDPHFRRSHWEYDQITDSLRRLQSTPSVAGVYSGCSDVLRYQDMTVPELRPGVEIRSQHLWGRPGVVVHLMSDLRATISTGAMTDQNVAVLVPRNAESLGAIWAYCSSRSFADEVRELDDSIKVTNATLGKVTFDLDVWTQTAIKTGQLPAPHSDNPTQWIFNGNVADSVHPLQVAVARILGYRWPEQEPDILDELADKDGIASLQSLPGEPDLASRLRELLRRAYGGSWSSNLERTLVQEAGGKNGRLEDWLRDTFFAQHAKVFDNRPFLWHIWDGRKDGFSAIVNYHKLDHRNLEKLTFTTLGAWIERQKHETAAGRSAADARLAAAEDLQARLNLILEGAPPYDLYVRWKELREQPIGWHPDLDDGVRLNIRPFVTAGVLRSKVNVHWKKDRGLNADGSERINDLHPTLEERREARRLAGVKP